MGWEKKGTLPAHRCTGMCVRAHVSTTRLHACSQRAAHVVSGLHVCELLTWSQACTSASCSRGLQACSQRAAHVVLACTWRRAVSSPRSLRCYLYVVCRAHAEVHALACCRPSAGAPEVRRRKRTMYSCGSLVGLEVVFAGACVCANRTPAPVIVQRARARVRVREEERRRCRCTLAMVSTMRCD